MKFTLHSAIQSLKELLRGPQGGRPEFRMRMAAWRGYRPSKTYKPNGARECARRVRNGQATRHFIRRDGKIGTRRAPKAA